MRSSVLLLALAAGCGSNGLPIEDGDLGLDCTQLTDEASCQAHGCVAHLCPSCGPTPQFEGCVAEGVPILKCPTPNCPPDCSEHDSAMACDAAPACYSLFTPVKCGCNGAGCCPMMFQSCELGAPVCTAGPTSQQPDCAPIAPCNPGYTYDYDADDCPIGCVEQSSCTTN